MSKNYKSKHIVSFHGGVIKNTTYEFDTGLDESYKYDPDEADKTFFKLVWYWFITCILATVGIGAVLSIINAILWGNFEINLMIFDLGWYFEIALHVFPLLLIAVIVLMIVCALHDTIIKILKKDSRKWEDILKTIGSWITK